MQTEDRAASAAWAWQMLQKPDTVILDTETTGLRSDAEVCQIAVIDLRGNVLLDTLVKTVNAIPAEAEAIHGISTKAAATAPPFAHMAVTLRQILADRTCLIYNRDFDLRVLRQSALAADLDSMIALPSSARFIDVMVPYAAFVGEWNDFKRSYKWQRLPSGDHSAVGDCRATRRLLFMMAGLEWIIGGK